MEHEELLNIYHNYMDNEDKKYISEQTNFNLASMERTIWMVMDLFNLNRIKFKYQNYPLKSPR